MRKGKLGVVVCLYPILGFVCVILNRPLLCALIFGFVLVAERDEWAGRQTLQALGLSAITAVVALGIGMPVATNGTLYCLQYDVDLKPMVQATFLSVVGSIATIPLVVSLI